VDFNEKNAKRNDFTKSNGFLAKIEIILQYATLS